MWNDETWTYEETVWSDTPDAHKQHIFDLAKREVGHRLYEILEQSRLPAVVDLKETIETAPIYERFAYDRIKIKLTITPVQYQHVTIQKANYELFKVVGFWQRLKWALKGQ